MKLVLLKNVKYGTETMYEVTNDFPIKWYTEDGYIQLSEVVEVEFPMLPPEAAATAEVAILDKQVTNVRADAEASITALEGRKQELLAISYEVAK